MRTPPIPQHLELDHPFSYPMCTWTASRPSSKSPPDGPTMVFLRNNSERRQAMISHDRLCQAMTIGEVPGRAASGAPMGPDPARAAALPGFVCVAARPHGTLFRICSTPAAAIDLDASRPAGLCSLHLFHAYPAFVCAFVPCLAQLFRELFPRHGSCLNQ